MTISVSLPANNWKPRDYQRPAWNEWHKGCKHLELIWHRRSGKDDIALHGTCIKAMERTANYWHMLPLANQARKAIWDAVNPHTGKRRIDEAFPHEIRATTREQEMFIKFKNGSTWQVLGSDNFQGAIGSTPAGIIYSEWAQSKPSAPGYLEPILLENNGWQLFITTPRGKNHAYQTYREALKNPTSFAQLLEATQTGVFTQEQLDSQRSKYIARYGESMGTALFEQEYLCSFEAAIIGAYYGEECRALEKARRLLSFEHDPDHPVHVVFDLGYDDDCVILFFQIIAGEIRVIDYVSNSGKDPSYYASQILGVETQINIVYGKVVPEYGDPIQEIAHRREFNIGDVWLPHDGKAKTLAAQGKSVQEQLATVFSWQQVKIVPSLSLQDGIQSARQMFPRVYFHERCEYVLETLKQYRREWDDDKNMFKDQPLHDWTSHIADAFRYLSIVWLERKPVAQEPPPPINSIHDMTFDQLLKETAFKKRQQKNSRI